MHRQQQNTAYVTSDTACYKVSLLIIHMTTGVAILRRPLGETLEPQPGRELPWVPALYATYNVDNHQPVTGLLCAVPIHIKIGSYYQVS